MDKLSRRGFLLGSAAVVVAAAAPARAIVPVAQAMPIYPGAIGEYAGIRFVEQMGHAADAMRYVTGLHPAMLGAFEQSMPRQRPRPLRPDQYVVVIPPHLVDFVRKDIAAMLKQDMHHGRD